MLSTAYQNTTETNSLAPAIADRLYRIADILADDWRGAGLDESFGSAMIVAVVRFLGKTGPRRLDGPRRTLTEQADFAEALLRRFWAINARRDAARHSEGRDRGLRPDTLPLDLVGEGAAQVRLYDSLGDDLLAGETGRDVARFLEGLGWPRERAWAFVWRESGREWDDVAFLLAERFEAGRLTPARLRKWGERYFEPVLSRVRAFLQGESGEPAAVSRADRLAAIIGVAVVEKREVKHMGN